MLIFKNWELKDDGEVLARQYDHLSRVLLVSGVPDGWDWQMLVRAGENSDIINLFPMEGGVGVVLTEQQLSIEGYYKMQLLGTLRSDGVTRRHTDILRVYVGKSLSGTANWPEVPSEFTQLEQSAWAAANKAQQIADQITGDAAWIYAEVGEDGCLYIVQGDAFAGASFAINDVGEMEVTYE